MSLKNLFQRNKGGEDFDNLMSGMIFLSKKTQEYFEDFLDQEESEKLDPLELGVFFPTFNVACYLLMRNPPNEADLQKFGEHVLTTVTRALAKTSKFPEIPRIRDKVRDIYNERVQEYGQFLWGEAEAGWESSAFVKTTCGVLNRLYGDEQTEKDRYDPMFASILLNHINAFGKILG